MQSVGSGNITITDIRDGISYQLSNSSPAIAKSVAGVLSPAAVTYAAIYTIGAGSPVGYAGRFIIATSENGVDFTNRYTSSSDESSKTYTVPAGVVAVRTRLYLAGGTSTLLDETRSNVVMDGTAGAAGLNNATVYLFKRSVDNIAPAVPSTLSTYTFATSTLSGHDNGWTQSLPATGGVYCWMTSAAASASGATDTIATGEWTTVASIAQDGAMGNANLVSNLGVWTI